MKWMEIKVVFDCEDTQQAADLIANAFHELEVNGVVIEDPGMEAPPEGWGKQAITVEYNGVTGYFPVDGALEQKCKEIEKKLAKLKKKNDIHYKIIYADLDHSDWAESWKAFYLPKKIGENIVVKPAWCQHFADQDEIVIEIDPGMAFGTGTHPTTFMCIQMVEKYLQRGDLFLDVGTGSGILMITAAKLGAGMVWGTDNDATAVNIARKNLLGNEIEKTAFHVIVGDLIDNVTEVFDLVAANLTSRSIITLLNDIGGVLAADGVFLCSGIPLDDKHMVEDEIDHAGFEIIETLDKEGWVSIACKIKGAF